AQHNDHPVFFPSLIWLPILHYFENYQTLLFLVGCAITLATLFLWIVSLGRSPTLGLTHRLALGLLMTVSTLWLGKANITASGGFSAMNSLATTAVLAGLLALSFLRTAEGVKRIGLLALVISSGLVATFSFATGLAAWPAYLLLAVFRRSGGRVACLLGASGLFAAVVFLLLPNDSKSEIGAGLGQIIFALPVLLLHFLQVLGSPWLHYASESAFDGSPAGWTYLTSAFLGGLGLAFAAWMAWRRYRAVRVYEPAETVALGMTFFILGSIALIVLGRTGLMTVRPDDVFAPRYCFWSPFFWAALPVLTLYSWARLCAFPSLFGLLALALTLGAIPSQVKIGQAYSQGRKVTETAALRLVCGVEDEASLQQLFRNNLFSAKIIYPLARIYRARSLDMFAWPGASLVGQRMPPPEDLPSQLPGTIWPLEGGCDSSTNT
nr:hypothetical protein [Chthoniobacterales bacterium]